MASLQEQLLKAGLADKNTARKLSKEKHKANKKAKKPKGTADQSTTPEISAMKLLNAERDRELNRKKQEAVEAKAVNAQIRQLIELNKIDTSDGEIAYNFVYANKVKKLYVIEEVQTALGNGRLVIVKVETINQTKFEIVPKAVAEKIAQRNAECIVHEASISQETHDENDPYADFKVPDDLMW